MRKFLPKVFYLVVLSFVFPSPGVALTNGLFEETLIGHIPARAPKIYQLPTITAPANVYVNTDLHSNVASGVLLGIPLTTGDGVWVSNNAPAVYPIGITTITWTVIDRNSATATANQTVTVTDKEKPIIDRMGEISVVNDSGKCGALVSLFIPHATDNSGVVTVSNDAPSPSFFQVGTRKITWTATDPYGNSDTSTQLITVIDNELPTISIGNIQVVNTAGKCGAVVKIGQPLTADNCGIAGVTNNAPSFFPVGTTKVTWTVTDIHQYTATAIQTITVTDAQKPTIKAPANIIVTAGAGKTSITNVNLGIPKTADNCGVKSVTNNGPSSYPIGITKVTWTVKDNSGNMSTTVQTVTVNKNQSNAAEIVQSYSTAEKVLPFTEQDMKITVAPNPSATYFTLRLESIYAMPVTLRISDASGRIVDMRPGLATNRTIQIGHNYYDGIYFAEMIQGKHHKTIQLIKVK